MKAAKALRWRAKIRINRKPAEAEVSRAVVKAFASIAPEAYDLSIDHAVEVPIRAGYGSSGAGALSLALALNEASKLDLSYTEAAQIAHLAEIECKTGLGTVLAETAGGVELRVKPGAPGIGEVRQIPTRSNEKVVSIYLGPLSTRPILEDEELQRRLSGVGSQLMEELMQNPTLANFLAISRRFSDGLNLYTPRMVENLKELDRCRLGMFDMNMFGEALFTLVETDGFCEFLSGLERVQTDLGRVIVSDVDREGARLIG